MNILVSYKLEHPFNNIIRKEYHLLSNNCLNLLQKLQTHNKIYHLNNSKENMGEVATKVCGSDNLLDMLIKKYGQNVGKFFAIEKVKQFLTTKIAQLKNMIEQQCQKILQQIMQLIDSKKMEVMNKFQQVKQMINQRFSGGISAIQKLRGQPLENILGLNTVMNNFDQVRNTATTRFEEQKNNVYRTIDQTAQQQKQNLNSQRPQIPIYDSLSDSQQRVVFQQAERLFANQIAHQKDTMTKQLGDKLQPNTYLNNFKNIVPMGSIDGIYSNGTSTFDMISKQLLSGGNLGGMMQGFQNIF